MPRSVCICTCVWVFVERTSRRKWKKRESSALQTDFIWMFLRGGQQCQDFISLLVWFGIWNKNVWNHQSFEEALYFCESWLLSRRETFRWEWLVYSNQWDINIILSDIYLYIIVKFEKKDIYSMYACCSRLEWILTGSLTAALLRCFSRFDSLFFLLLWNVW